MYHIIIRILNHETQEKVHWHIKINKMGKIVNRVQKAKISHHCKRYYWYFNGSTVLKQNLPELISGLFRACMINSN